MWKFVWKYLSKHKCSLIIMIVVLSFTSIANLILPLCNGSFVDSLLITPTFKIVMGYASIIIVLGALDVALSYLYNLLLLKMLNEISYEAKFDALKHCRKTSFLNIEKYDANYLNQRLTMDINIIFNFILHNLFNAGFKTITIACSFILIFSINRVIGILVVLFTGIYVILYLLLKKRMFLCSNKYKDEQAKLYSEYNNQFLFIKDHKIKANFHFQNKRIEMCFEKYKDALLTYGKLQYIISSCDKLIGFMLQSIVLVICGINILEHRMTIGQFTMITAYYTILLQHISFYFNIGKMYQDSKSSLVKIKEIYNIPEEVNGEVSIDKINSIELSNLTFRYDSDISLLENMNYRFETGNIYGIVGANGTGKTTLIYSLCGLLNEQAGKNISYNEYNLEELNAYVLRQKSISVMPQTRVFAKGITIMDAIREGVSFSSQNDIERRIEELCVGNLFEKEQILINSWDRVEVDSLSSGEQKKVSFLQCILKSAEVYLFDEPTANMDSKTSDLIKDVLSNLAREHIVIIVTHDTDLLKICAETLELNSNIQ